MKAGDGASAREPMLDGEAREAAEEAASASSPAEPAAPEEEEVVPPVSFCALFRYMRPADRLVLLLAILGAVAQATTGPAMSFFMKDLFQSVFWPNDDGTVPPTAGPHEERDRQVRKAALIFLLLAAIAMICGSLAYLGFARVADNMTFELKPRFFEHLLKKEVGWYDLHSSASMATRLTNDTYDFRQGTGEKLVNLIVGMTMSPLGFAVAFTQDWRLTLMMLLAVPLMGVGFGMAMKQMTGSAAKQQQFYAKAGGVAETTLSSIRTVAAFGGFPREIEKYRAQLRGAERDGIRAGWCNGFSMGFLQVSIYGFFALGFYAGAFLVISDYNDGCWESDPPFGTCFTGPKMLSTLWAVLYGGIGLGQVAPALATLTAAKAAAGRIYAVLDEPPAFDLTAGDSPEDVQGSIDFKDVVFAYPSRPELPALSRASFSVPAGKTAAFVGPSGSGKSTTIALLQRFYDPQCGSVCFDGRDIRSLNLTWLRSKMALVQQEPVLFSGTIQENIAYGREGSSSRDIEVASKAANAHTFIMGFPDKYRTQVGERGVMMSGGQKQRIAIARAMVRNPAALLLDEATSALDTESERVVQKALDDLMAQQARTTLVVAHRLSTIRNADQIFVLENGTLLERGTHSELMQKEGSLYAQLVELQQLTASGEEDPETPAGDASPTGRPRQLSSQLSRELSRSLSRQLTGGTPTGRLERANTSGEVARAQPDAPPEDDEPIPAPTSRLWALQPQLAVVALALLCTLPVAAARPFMGWLFAEVGNLFSQPPARFDVATMQWVGAMDVDDVRSKTNIECLKFAIMAVCMGALTFSQLGLFRRAAESLTREVRLLTFKAMLRQEVAWFDVRTSGHLADRLAAEAPLIKSFTGEALAAVLQLFITVCTGLGMATFASWQLTLSSFIFVPLVTCGQAAMVRAMRKTNDTSAGPLVSQAMGNIRTVASFSLGRQMMKRYLALLTAEGRQERKTSRATGIMAAYQGGIMYVMFGGIVFIANIFITKGWIRPDAVMQVLFPLMFSASGAAQASQWSADKAKAQTAVSHLFHTLDRTPLIDAYDESGEQPDSVKGEIEFRHVVFRYPSRPDVSVFADFDLKVEPGTTVAFCGPSGSGKSTTIALLQRFYTPDQGSVCLDGRDIATLNLGWLRRQMALVQQEPVLFAGSVLENIAYGREGATQQECQHAAEAANAHGFVAALPDGYATEVGERGTQLSGGQKQRIAIARSMVRDPAVLLLDEATSALDTESERVVQEALDKLLQQSRRTTLVIAHRLSTIVNSDVICVIYQGQIVEKGTHAELMRIGDGHYKKLASRQQGR